MRLLFLYCILKMQSLSCDLWFINGDRSLVVLENAINVLLFVIGNGDRGLIIYERKRRSLSRLVVEKEIAVLCFTIAKANFQNSLP